jgi:hypothetical protein
MPQPMMVREFGAVDNSNFMCQQQHLNRAPHEHVVDLARGVSMRPYGERENRSVRTRVSESMRCEERN